MENYKKSTMKNVSFNTNLESNKIDKNDELKEKPDLKRKQTVSEIFESIKEGKEFKRIKKESNLYKKMIEEELNSLDKD